ncbi:MAG: nitroreductase family deazaflavin-dependent oxidoreductase [Anaerolineaceae bacterium]|nr:nitroreductase family deazaflavin-dependent oxidoreductase [Anaerolineaceae bacterium]
MNYKPEYLYLTTTGWKSGQPHEIEIWYVTQAGRYYVVAERGEQAHFVQNIRHNPTVSFYVAGARHAGQGRMVDPTAEPERAAAVRALMDAKYNWSEGVIVELTATP